MGKCVKIITKKKKPEFEAAMEEMLNNHDVERVQYSFHPKAYSAMVVIEEKKGEEGG